jgi:CRP-like cAMP-binding protein
MDLTLLRSVTLFKDLDDAELTAFLSILQAYDVQTDELILQEGAPVGHLYLVSDGMVQVRRDANGKEILLARLGPGAFFGEVNLFDPAGVATATIYAMKPTRMAVVDYATMLAFMETYPATGYKIVTVITAELAKRLRRTDEKLVSFMSWGNQSPQT